MVERKIPINVNSWLVRCEEKVVYDSEVGSDVRFYDMFEMPEFDDFDKEVEHIVEGRVRLDLLANKYYGSPKLWWIIAARNNMDLPDAELYEGQKLKIPSTDFVKNKLLRG